MEAMEGERGGEEQRVRLLRLGAAVFMARRNVGLESLAEAHRLRARVLVALGLVRHRVDVCEAREVERQVRPRVGGLDAGPDEGADVLYVELKEVGPLRRHVPVLMQLVLEGREVARVLLEERGRTANERVLTTRWSGVLGWSDSRHGTARSTRAPRTPLDGGGGRVGVDSEAAELDRLRGVAQELGHRHVRHL